MEKTSQVYPASEANEFLREALYYASRHIQVIPLRQRDKIPITKNGLHDGTCDKFIIENWWRNFPDANVGIVTGEDSGLMVLDVDPRHHGDRSLKAIQQHYEDLPSTPTVQTGGNGLHLYFKYPTGSRVRNRAAFLPGLDLKVNGGYVVAPPSIHPNGLKYKWDADKNLEKITLAEAPGWLMTLVLPAASEPSEKSKKSLYDLFIAGAAEGARNNSIASMVGYLLRKNVDPRIVLELLRCWNKARNTPPLPEQEVAKVVNSISRLEAQRRIGVTNE